METKKPVERIRAKQITASIWENQTKDGRTFYSYTITRSYKDGESWKSSSSFSRFDLSQVLAATVGADEWIRARELEGERRQALEDATRAGD